jgi:hypothetical protein
MNPVNLYATGKGDFAPASSLTPSEAVAVRDELSPEEILHDLTAEAREAVLRSYALRGYRTPQGDVVVVWGVAKPVIARTGNA